MRKGLVIWACLVILVLPLPKNKQLTPARRPGPERKVHLPTNPSDFGATLVSGSVYTLYKMVVIKDFFQILFQ